MQRCLILFLIALIISSFSCSSESNQDELDQIYSAVNEIRGLEPLYEFNHRFITPNELCQELSVKQEEEINIDQEIYTLLGLLDEGDNLNSILLAENTQYTTGFFDVSTGEMVIVADGASMTPKQKATVAHEYTHILQDQYGYLDSYWPELANNTDACLAFDALIEGEATLVKHYYMDNYLSYEELYSLYTDTTSEAGNSTPYFIQQIQQLPYEVASI